MNHEFTSPERFASDSKDIGLHLSRLFKEINRKVSAGTNFNLIFDFLFDSLSLVIPFDRMSIALLDRSQQLVTANWEKTKLPELHLKEGYSAPLRGSSLEAILQSKTPRIINDLRLHMVEHPQSESTKLILREGIRSSMTCPLIVRGRPIGFVFFSSAQPDTYSRQHVGLFQEIANELSILTELSRLHHSELEIKERSRVMRTLLHDLRSPLSIIHGFIGAIEDEEWYKKLDPKNQSIFRIILKNTNFMFSLIDEISQLNIARAKDELTLQRVNLNEFLSELAEYGRCLGERKNIHVSFALPTALPESLYFDKSKIRRVIENLLSNAIKFSWPDSQVTVTICCLERRLNVAVTDHGQGIAADEMKILFREFGRTSTLPTDGETSTGLGLAIAKEIVQAHRGEITARSERGQGSVFEFWIPWIDQPSPSVTT